MPPAAPTAPAAPAMPQAGAPAAPPAASPTDTATPPAEMTGGMLPDDAMAEVTPAPMDMGMGMEAAQPPSDLPRIPEPTETCPDFTSGTQTIKGLRTDIEAGTPGDVKGAILFSFHGTGGRGRLSSVPASVRAEIVAEGGIVLAPTGNVRGDGRTDLAPPTGAWFLEDMEFTDLVVACAVQNHNVDPKRIYATGCSAGGLMAGTLGLMRSEYMAAVAPNSGGINYMGSRMLSETSHGPAAFTMHGGSGDNVIVNFQDTSQWFHAQNQLASNMPYMLDCNHGRGHCGAPTSLHEMAWEFMKAHPYDVGESPWVASPPASLPDYCVPVE